MKLFGLGSPKHEALVLHELNNKDLYSIPQNTGISSILGSSKVLTWQMVLSHMKMSN